MTFSTQRINYDRIAHLYDEPGRDYDTDPTLVEFLKEKTSAQFFRFRMPCHGCGSGKQLAANHDKIANIYKQNRMTRCAILSIALSNKD